MGTLLHCKGEKAFTKDIFWTLIYLLCVLLLSIPYSFLNETLRVIINSIVLNNFIGPLLSDVYCILGIIFSCELFMWEMKTVNILLNDK